jgi:protein-glutamine gamma-glutamyltransferase
VNSAEGFEDAGERPEKGIFKHLRNRRMKFLTYFRAFSYAMIGVAMLALVLAGGLDYGLALAFLVIMIVSWKLERTRWQLPERIGLGIVLLSIPLFYLDWHYQKSLGEPAERLGVTALAHLIVFLSAVKLLQVKKDRDWVFLYLISFFEVLLAAGLSFSPVFLGTLTLYLLCGLSAVTAFEIQKARRSLRYSETRLLVPPDSRVFKKGRRSLRSTEAARLPVVALALLILIFAFALPLFLIAPRSGAAALTRSGGGLSNFIGFSENVTLGQIGTLKQDDGLVMRVGLESTEPPHGLRWRGVALDEFTGMAWRKSPDARQSQTVTERAGFFRLGTTEALHRLTTQTFFLEPLESSVLFAAPRAVALQGDLQLIRVDAEGSIQSRRHDFERLMYKAISDTDEPAPEQLRRDMRPYPSEFKRYLQLPETLDPRITGLARTMLIEAHARNRYDAAKAIEWQLQRDYGYSLQMKAGGPDPLSDFLFNVRTGHCEYFSTAMTVLLRTHGVAARVVNGFLPGEFNETAGAYTVRQSDAHSWVEVYFPETDSWVTFDPTPSAGRVEPVRTGLTAQLQKYVEALELLWFQYIVGYDKQEQRSLATSLHNQIFDYARMISNAVTTIRGYLTTNVLLLLLGLTTVVLGLAFVLFGKRLWQFVRWRGGKGAIDEGRAYSNVQFYEKLLNVMEQRGVLRDKYQTPLEFADKLKSREAMIVTRAYNRVRYGGERLSNSERREVERALVVLEADFQG